MPNLASEQTRLLESGLNYCHVTCGSNYIEMFKISTFRFVSFGNLQFAASVFYSIIRGSNYSSQTKGVLFL